jgi:putative ABC transport system permease protein
MSSGLALQALRRYRGALLGPACTQALAAGVISMMIMTAISLSRSPLSPRDHAAVVASDIGDTTAVFIGISIYLSILMVGVTMNLATVQQIRDIALLRVIGASPGQIRRSVAVQAAAVAVPATIVGFLAAVPAGALWVAALKAHHVLPQGVRFAPQIVAAPIALGIGVSTSVVGAVVASARTARVAPTVALTEAATGRRPVGRTRVTLGIVLVLGGAGLSGILSRFAPDQANDAAFFVMLAECIGVGMLGPVVLGRAAQLVRSRAVDGISRLAVDDLATMSRSLSGALVPLVLAAAFAIVKVAIHTTTADATGITEPAADLWTDYSGTAIYAAFAGVAALNCLILVVSARRQDLAAMQLAGGTRRTLVKMVGVEALVVTASGLVLASGVAGITLAPILHTSLGRWAPYIPVPVVVGGAVLVAALVVAGMVVPAAIITRQPAIEVVAEGP